MPVELGRKYPDEIKQRAVRLLMEAREQEPELSWNEAYTEHGCKIAPSTYYSHKKRGACLRQLRDEKLCQQIQEVFFDRKKGRSICGYRKVWRYLKRDGVKVACCTVERLMKRLGLRGITREGKRVITTVADEHLIDRAPDLVKRDFTATEPNQLWVEDFCYVSTWQGTAYTAFVEDVFNREIVGWRVASRMPTELPLDALDMALWIRGLEGENVIGACLMVCVRG